MEFVWDQDQDQRRVKSDTPVGQQTLTAFGDNGASISRDQCRNRNNGLWEHKQNYGTNKVHSEFPSRAGHFKFDVKKM